MPALSEMFAFCQRVAFDRTPDEIYAALDSAGYLVYTRVLKEQAGYFIKEDTTSLTLTPSAATGPYAPQTFALPNDLDQILFLGESPIPNIGGQYQRMAPGRDLTAVEDNLGDDDWMDFAGDAWNGQGSQYSYYGPYLPASEAQGTPDAASQQQMIDVSPVIESPRACLLIYHAKWLRIIDDASPVMMAEQGTYAMQHFAAAELLEDMDDTRAQKLMARGERYMQGFLSDLRDRDGNQQQTIKGYL